MYHHVDMRCEEEYYHPELIEIELFCDVFFELSLCPFDISVGALVISLNQISSFLSYVSEYSQNVKGRIATGLFLRMPLYIFNTILVTTQVCISFL